MDHQWHHQRPIQGDNICPTCSISHFPFCPPLPTHDMNPRFQVPPNQFDPYHVCAPYSHSNDHNRYWNNNNTNPNLVKDNLSYNTSSVYNGFKKESSAVQYGYSNKRMRVDEMGSGVSTNEYYNYQNSGNNNNNGVGLNNNNGVGFMYGEDERRLKLIREHGSGFSYNQERGGYVQQSAVMERSFGGSLIGENRKFDELQGARIAPVIPSNGQVNNAGNRGYGSVDRRGSVLHSEGVSNVHGSWNGHYVSPIHDEADRYFSGVGNGDLNHQVQMMQNVHHPNPEVPLRNYNIQNGATREHSNWQRSGVLHQEYRSSSVSETFVLNNVPPQPYTVGGGHLKIPVANGMVSDSLSKMQPSQVNDIHPPLPTSPPPPLPLDPPGYISSDPKASYMQHKPSSSHFPVVNNSSGMAPSSHPPVPEGRPVVQPYVYNKTNFPSSNDYAKELHAVQQTPSQQYVRREQQFSASHCSLNKPKLIDATHVFRQPHRAIRPDHIVVILRGLPGSGKSYLAKMLRDIELENGGDAPRIHSIDDYFMTEVEKVEEVDNAKSSSSARSRKPIMKKVMEYCYEPEMEEAYRSSMLKAFKKTLEEGDFTFVIVDDRNLRVADFAQFWAIAKRSGYEVYLLEAPYKDPVGCAARNVHSFTQADIQKMAREWEEAPSLYLQLDIKSLFHGDNLKDSGIQEVDMDMEDGTLDEGLPGLHERINGKTLTSAGEDDPIDGLGSSKDQERVNGNGAEDHSAEGVKELRRSKWSNDADEGETLRTENAKKNINALSGLVQAYSKEGKSVHWGDQVGNTGFSIGVAKKANVLSLVIGPGAGYNQKSNPLLEEGNLTSSQSSRESRRESIFQERLRAERESFKVIFDRRRQRIGGLDLEDE